ncbi:MAG: NAD(P)/FAD-dependent oxidoreductase [Pseudomonadota bacterium]
MDKKEKATERIVIVGGGVAGLALASELGKKLGKVGRPTITLVDRGPLHVWKPMLHEFAAGTADPHDRGIAFPVQARRRGFAFVPGEMTTFDPTLGTLTLKFPGDTGEAQDLRKVSYDTLVLATGSRANDFGTPGVSEHCHYVDDLRNALVFNEALRREIGKSVFAHEPISIAIVGGGATGVELAAEVRKLVQVGASFGASDLEARLQVTLIESNGRILKAMDERSAMRAAKRLEDVGVRIMCNQRVVSVDADGLDLSDGQRIAANLKVWAAGVRSNLALQENQFSNLTRSGQLVVDHFLHVKGLQGVFALGDCSALQATGSSDALPPTAQVASQQASYLARAIIQRYKGREFTEPFRFIDRGSLVSLGAYGSFGLLPEKGFAPSILISGLWASALHPLFYRAHTLRILGPALGLVGWVRDGLTSLLRPRIKF